MSPSSNYIWGIEGLLRQGEWYLQYLDLGLNILLMTLKVVDFGRRFCENVMQPNSFDCWYTASLSKLSQSCDQKIGIVNTNVDQSREHIFEWYLCFTIIFIIITTETDDPKIIIQLEECSLQGDRKLVVNGYVSR